jgi:hypothetical protein
MTTILHGFLDFFSLPMVLQFLSMNEKTESAIYQVAPNPDIQEKIS